MYGSGGNGSLAMAGESVGYASPPGAAQRIPAVSEQVVGFSKRTEQLHELISGLERRIEAIVRPAPPPAGGNAADKRSPAPVSLAGSLSELNERLDYAISRLDSLVNRIEL
jgi:hypothetical protein